MTKRFSGRNGRVERLHAVRLRFGEPDAAGQRPIQEIPGTEFEIPAELVLLAMGFVHPVREGLVRELGVELDSRGNVRADTRHFSTSEPGIFAAGDCRRGQSLVVWAQWEGREAARAVDPCLSRVSRLPARDAYV
jgi:glutamate synthase (NADPH/NADH) small chain